MLRRSFAHPTSIASSMLMSTAMKRTPAAASSLLLSSQRSSAHQLSKEALAKAWMQVQFTVQGHKMADYDPLKQPKPSISELEPAFYGLSEKDPDVIEIIKRGKQLFLGSSSTEFSHLNTDGQSEWIATQVMNKQSIPKEAQRRVLRQLLEADVLEDFFNKRFGATKRFGLEGGESLIPGLHALIEAAAEGGADRVVLGMAHRGRLQVLHHLCGKPLWKIFREFQDVIIPGTQMTNKGDVKYHLGHKTTTKALNGKEVIVECLPNPSHLEAVNPVVTGYTRGYSELLRKPEEKPDHLKRAVPVLLHGDAAIIGQGVCFETMLFEEVRDYQVGGTIHVVVNNQVGFTTDPTDSRSVQYSTALAYLNNSPVIRVNGDSPLRVMEAFRLAARHRDEFKEDVFIDLVCYRRKGHNEGDSPDFTQPKLYQKIKAHPTTAKIFSDILIKEKVVTQEEVEEWREDIMDRYKAEYNKASDKSNSTKPTLLAPREFPGYEHAASHNTGVSVDKLQALGKQLTDKAALPKDFNPHPGVWNNTIEQRRKSFESGSHILWASAEQLALASLISEGYNVRYSGEDVQRGTWAQRHFVLHNTNDKKLGEEFSSLKQLSAENPEKHGKITLANSPLSEYGVAGYEFGYSVARPDSLTLWEAQFGDFANGAQIVWDQFLSSSSTKWGQRCGLAVSLPHGYDGQGPEHSSARIERFLQCCNEPVVLPGSASHDSSTVDPYSALEGRNIGSNWTICYPTTPGNYFHMLRRQVMRKAEVRVPLVFFFSKGGLRVNGSNISEMGEGTRFEPVIINNRKPNVAKEGEPAPAAVDPAGLKTVILCTGQISGTLLTRRKQVQMNDSTAIIRLEQLAPFPYELLRKALRSVGANENTRFVWAQEEPKNNGAWNHIRPRVRALFKSVFNQKNSASKNVVDVEFAGRPSSASPATGYGHVHEQELHDLLNKAFGTNFSKKQIEKYKKELGN